MAKQTIFGRIAQLAKANINALIDAAEEPEKMLDQMVRDYTNNIREAEAAVAQTIGNLRLLEKDHAEDVKAAQEWGTKALAASNKADEFRAAGDVANADKFDNLAKIALNKQLLAENAAKTVEPQLASQTQVVNQLKDGLAKRRFAAKRHASSVSRSWLLPPWTHSSTLSTRWSVRPSWKLAWPL